MYSTVHLSRLHPHSVRTSSPSTLFKFSNFIKHSLYIIHAASISSIHLFCRPFIRRLFTMSNSVHNWLQFIFCNIRHIFNSIICKRKKNKPWAYNQFILSIIKKTISSNKYAWNQKYIYITSLWNEVISWTEKSLSVLILVCRMDRSNQKIDIYLAWHKVIDICQSFENR